ncbi:MAG: hypothetical protein Q8N76_04030, partial [Candidatus Omnitrophota bacterium]|nr:hypothetical protein [Candidatus Omnitrophota bacterium]
KDILPYCKKGLHASYLFSWNAFSSKTWACMPYIIVESGLLAKHYFHTSQCWLPPAGAIMSQFSPGSQKQRLK